MSGADWLIFTGIVAVVIICGMVADAYTKTHTSAGEASSDDN